MDIDLLLLLKTRENHDKWGRFIKPAAVGKETWSVLQAMGEWFKHDKDADVISWSHFNAWYCLVRHAKMDRDTMALHKALIDKLEVTPDPDPTQTKLLLEGLITRDYASQIAEKALKIADGDFSVSINSVSDLVDSRNIEIGRVDGVDSHILLPSLEGLKAVCAPGLQWRLECLRMGLGDLRKGNLIVAGMRPDTGKTTLLASEATYMAPQLPEDESVLWVNNEQAGDEVWRRIIQCGLRRKGVDIDKDPLKALDDYKMLVGRMDKIIMLNKASVHVRDVEHMLKKYKIGLIIFDQLWKVHGFDAEAGTEVVRQTLLFNWAREMAKTYGPVINVHQAGGLAEGTKWIDMGKLYGSQTGIQGEADAIITIGRLPETGNARYLYLPKNKLPSPGDPSLRNGMWEIEIEPEVGRFKEFTK